MTLKSNQHTKFQFEIKFFSWLIEFPLSLRESIFVRWGGKENDFRAKTFWILNMMMSVKRVWQENLGLREKMSWMRKRVGIIWKLRSWAVKIFKFLIKARTKFSRYDVIWYKQLKMINDYVFLYSLRIKFIDYRIERK